MNEDASPGDALEEVEQGIAELAEEGVDVDLSMFEKMKVALEVARARRRHRRRVHAEAWREKAAALTGQAKLDQMFYGEPVEHPAVKPSKIRLRRPRRAPITVPPAPSRWRAIRAEQGVSKREAKLLAYPGRRFRW